MTEAMPQAQAVRIFGVAASFDDADALLAACAAVRERGYRRFEAYTPFPVEGLAEAVGHGPSRVPWIALGGAVAGGVGVYAMMWFASVVHYPLNIGGKPPHSWPAFIPVTFELSVLGAALGAVFGMFVLCRLPQPYHPLFDVAAFRRASRDRFFLCVEAADPLFDRAECRELLSACKPCAVVEVPIQ